MGGNRRSIETLGTASTFLHDLGLSAGAMVAAPLLVLPSAHRASLALHQASGRCGLGSL